MNDIFEYIIDGTHCIIAKRDGTWISFIFKNMKNDILDSLKDARPFHDIKIGRCFVSSMFYDQRCIIFKPYHDKIGEMKSETHDLLTMAKLYEMFPNERSYRASDTEDNILTLMQEYYKFDGLSNTLIMLGGRRW